jgi:O-antigen/teichoic acid export membrane protein
MPTENQSIQPKRNPKKMAAVATKCLGLAGAIGFPLLLAFHHGTRDAGIIQFFLSVATMIASFTRLGWDHVLFRAGAVDDLLYQRHYLMFATKKTCLIGFLSLALYSLLVSLLVQPASRYIAWIAGFAITPLAIAWMVGEFEKGRSNTLAWSLLNNTGLYVICLSVLAPAILIGEADAVVTTCLFVFSAWVVALSGWFWSYRRHLAFGCDISEDKSLPMNRAMLWESLHLAPLSFASSAQTWLDVTVVGLLSTPESVTLIRLAGRFSFLPAFFNGVIIASLAPRLARAIHQGNIDEVRRLWRLTALIPVLAGLACSVAVLIALGFGGSLLADKGIQSLPYLVCVLSIGQLLAFGTGAAGYILLTCRMDQTLNRYALAGLPVAAMLQFALAAPFGAWGSAIASAIYLPLFRTLLFIEAKKAVNILDREGVPSTRAREI